MATVYDIQGNVIPFQNAVSESKIAHVHSKRNLSSSSTSPRPADKKLKSFVSPNRFEVLQSDNESSECVLLPSSEHTAVRETQPQTDVIKNATRFQPIYIKNITNFTLFKNKLYNSRVLMVSPAKLHHPISSFDQTGRTMLN